MITSRQEACRILEVPLQAGIEEIKHAYKTKSKQFHPDVCKSPQGIAYFYQVQEAYEYCTKNITFVGASGVSTGGRIFGTSQNMEAQKRRTATREDYAHWEKRYQKQQKEKKEAFEQRQAQVREKRLQEEELIKDFAPKVAEILRKIITQ